MRYFALLVWASSLCACEGLVDAFDGDSGGGPDTDLGIEIDDILRNKLIQIDSRDDTTSFIRAPDGAVHELELEPFAIQGLDCDIIDLRSTQSTQSTLSFEPLTAQIGYVFEEDGIEISCTEFGGAPSLIADLSAIIMSTQAAFCLDQADNEPFLQISFSNTTLTALQVAPINCGSVLELCDPVTVSQVVPPALATYLEDELERGLNTALEDDATLAELLTDASEEALEATAPDC